MLNLLLQSMISKQVNRHPQVKKVSACSLGNRLDYGRNMMLHTRLAHVQNLAPMSNDDLLPQQKHGDVPSAQCAL